MGTRILVFSLAFAALAAAASDAFAVPTFYTVRNGVGSFNADARTGATAFEDFESPGTALPAAPNSFYLDSGPYDSTGVGSTAYGAGDLIPGFQISDPGGTATVNGGAFFVPAGFSHSVGHSTGAQFGGATTISFTAGDGVTAVGFDLHVTSGGGGPTASTVSVQAFDFNNNAYFALPQTTTSAVGSYVFAGVVVDAAIQRVVVTTTGNQVVLIDNLVFNPEPSSWALMALGLGGLVGVVRRRRRARA
jgi:hypothetical protein